MIPIACDTDPGKTKQIIIGLVEWLQPPIFGLITAFTQPKLAAISFSQQVAEDMGAEDGEVSTLFVSMKLIQIEHHPVLLLNQKEQETSQ